MKCTVAEREKRSAINFKPQPHQQFLMEAFKKLGSSSRGLLLFHSLGTGKCVDPKTVVETSNGNTTFEDLWNSTRGEIVMDPVSAETFDEPPSTYHHGYEEWKILDDTEDLMCPSFVDKADGSIEYKNVFRLFRQYVVREIMDEVVLEDGTFIQMTKRHKLYTQDGYKTRITKKDRVLTKHLKYVKVVDAREYTYTGFVYDLEVPYTHSYIIQGVVSHNTCSAYTIIDEFMRDQIRNNTGINRGVVLAPAALIETHRSQYCEMCGDFPDAWDPDRQGQRGTPEYKMYSLNAYGTINKHVTNLDDTFLIIDEVQILLGGKQNESPSMSKLYDTIHRANNLKILMLSATPIYTTYTAYLCMELLKPTNQILSRRNFSNIVSTRYRNDFEAFFTRHNHENYLKHTVSYVPIVDFGNYPRRKPDEIHIERMTQKHYNKYLEAEEHQFFLWRFLNRLKSLYRQRPSIKILRDIQSISYQITTEVYTLSAGNLVYPGAAKRDAVDEIKNIDEAERVLKQTNISPKEVEMLVRYINRASEPESVDEIVSRISEIPRKYKPKSDLDPEIKSTFNHRFLEHIKDYAPKILRILCEVIKPDSGKHMIFSRRTNRHGLYAIANILGLVGIQYKTFTGDTSSDKKRAQALEDFNSPANARGERYKVILVSSAGSAGINLKGVRHVHVLEPHINETLIEQAIGRAFRYKSHDQLTPEENDVTVHRYFVAPPKDSYDGKIVETLMEHRDKYIRFLYNEGDGGDDGDEDDASDDVSGGVQHGNIDYYKILLEPGHVDNHRSLYNISADFRVYLKGREKLNESNTVLKLFKDYAVDCSMEWNKNEGLDCRSGMGIRTYTDRAEPHPSPDSDHDDLLQVHHDGMILEF